MILNFPAFQNNNLMVRDVSEEFLAEVLECYREKYGLYVEVDGYVIQFDPVLTVYEKI